MRRPLWCLPDLPFQPLIGISQQTIIRVIIHTSQISLRKEKRKKKHTCVFGSNPHVAPEDTTQFAPTAPWPRCNSTVSRSITLVESLDVNVKFKDPISD